MDWPATMAKVMRGEELSYSQASHVMSAIMSGELSPERLAAFLTALRMKGESVNELQALADVMVDFAHPLPLPGVWLDIVGTGGDLAHTVNISTMAALVCAGAGESVAKHGNRASSSSTGTADVLEELGVNLTQSPDLLLAQAERVPMVFLFAQQFHPAMKHAAPTRREMAVPTAFNFLGPLTNPARPQVAAIGCADRSMAPVMAGVFAQRGSDAAVFRGDDGLDELSIATSSSIWWVWRGDVEELTVHPEQVGLPTAGLDALRGGDRVHNAQVVRDLLAGVRGPIRDAVVLNASIALVLSSQFENQARFGGAASLAEAMKLQVVRAETAIDSGAAQAILEEWIAVSGHTVAG